MAIIENILRNKLDKRANKESEKGLKRIDDATAKTGKTAIKSSKQSKKANQTTAKSANAVVGGEKQKQKAIKETTSVAKQQAKAFSETSERFAAFGDIESGARGGAGIIGVAGGETGKQIESAIGSLAEIPAAIEALPRMGQAIKGLGIRAVAAATGQTALATAETATGTAAAGATTGLSAMLIPLLPLAAIAVALAGGFFLLNRASKSAEERAKKLEEAYKAQADTSAELAVALESGDNEAAIATYQELLSQQAIEQRKVNDATERANKIAQDEAKDTTQNIGGFFKDVFNATDLDKQADEAVKTQEEYTDALAITNAQVEAAGQTLQEFGIDVSNIPSAEAAAKEKELATERARASTAIDNLREQEANLQAKRAQAQSDQNQDRNRRDSRAAQDSAEADMKRNEQSAKAAQEGADRITAIRREGVEQEADTINKANDDLAKTINEGSAKRAELENDFENKAIESQNRFNERRAQAQRNSENQEFDAIQANDIIGALRAQRNAEQQQQQADNDFRTEQAQREAEKQERLTALRAEQAERTAEIQANLQIELAEQKVALREKIAAERAAIRERVANEKKAAADAEKARQKQLRRQAEDDALQDARSQRAFEEQLQRIEDQKKAEQQALAATFETIQGGTQAMINVIGQSAQAAINATGQIGQQAITAMGNAANNAFSGGSSAPQAMADGGRISAGSLAQVNDSANRRQEFFRPDVSGRIIPLAENIVPGRNSSGGGGMTNVNIDLTVGDIATGQQVVQSIQGAFAQMAQTDVQVLADSLAGVG